MQRIRGRERKTRVRGMHLYFYFFFSLISATTSFEMLKFILKPANIWFHVVLNLLKVLKQEITQALTITEECLISNT